MTPIDRLIIEFDTALRSVVGGANSQRPTPGSEHTSNSFLDASEREHAAGLMRVNHVGEVCAQALYQSQKLVARKKEIQQMLDHSGQEEMDHLAWCEMRLQELGSHTSYLNPFWYAGSFAIGLVAGLAGDKWSLGFVAETEKQVENHLESHLKKLPAEDRRSRAIVEQMRVDEFAHGQAALKAGGVDLPRPIKTIMQLMSKVMTSSAYRI
ncbi:ubiquinone biosynthesis monooxygenase Coq7 [Polynucleobacter sphagniphilus]|jgi:ubiquinone biosynthesis monooxygenase Coq7|uniref:3-demethoxyubiquinol 3-hydroxylase n=1 Tax=Polynucleobacter sphagniphilus TaxID=1743169 RepID=A0AA43MAU9_9BURK|nr:ubiquinone biosynthesis monooxygenase Coq7 [Polynucleobacter sphagniphilus]MDH6153891.1 ubiquinone biosynthesis monooxygenase Coq7 [Polynucleobacter sphagniphilus]MDH6242069.1 ubiquinone biosynthesis monooxygenase Coq7 [Polynucleobacter sphagniphilus]MDH6248546.1 ubiquinone biosynthesis monooxygenase Coq7 [Polynucleobacter sphagniphilus]MDH6299013.1 ubiquinone biosynthesis monooxygenase Coq7 [Polynucleobacter sphagniphilus]